MSDGFDKFELAIRFGEAAQHGNKYSADPNQWPTVLGIEAVAPLIRAQALEEAAKVAEYAHMVPPDGGSPSDAEFQVAKNAAAAIRALKE